MATDTGERFRERREGAGLTQARVAELVGVTQQYVSQFEKGKATPSRELLERYARLVGLTAEQLIEGP